MPALIVVVDPEGELGNATTRAFTGADVSVECVADVTAAKRGLVTAKPDLIVCPAIVGESPEAGFTFCGELARHTVLSKIPFVLVSSQVTQDAVKKAGEVGAKGILPWPCVVDLIAERLSSLLPGVTIAPQRPAFATAPAQPAPRDPSAVSQRPGSPMEDEKIKIAQQLLAKVLHNLKTSDLLQVVENEDVPRIVLEMTRSVCGVDEEPEEKSDEVNVDLDMIFGKSS